MHRKRLILTSLLLCLASMHLASVFFGSLAWWIDVWSHFQLQIGISLLFLALLVWVYTGNRWATGAVLLYATAVLGWVFLLYSPAPHMPPEETMGMYYQNVLFSAPPHEHDAMVNAFAEYQARVYAFVEPTPYFLHAMETRLGVAPVTQRATSNTGCAVFVTDSSLAVLDANTITHPGHDPMCVVRFTTFDLYVVHPLPPLSKESYARQNALFASLRALIEDSHRNGRMWLAVGDFNATLYSARFRHAFGEYAHRQHYTWITPSLMMLPIDHAFGTLPHETRLYPAYASDHRGLGISFTHVPTPSHYETN